MPFRPWRRPTALLLAAAMTLAGTPVRAAEAKTVTFQVMDELGPGQVDEEIAVSINHLPVGVLKVNAARQRDSLTVTVPAARTYHYDLCGRLENREGNATVEHRIDNGGDFPDLDGHTLVAMTSNSVVFYLVDETPGDIFGPSQTIVTAHGCANTVAML